MPGAGQPAGVYIFVYMYTSLNIYMYINATYRTIYHMLSYCSSSPLMLICVSICQNRTIIYTKEIATNTSWRARLARPGSEASGGSDRARGLAFFVIVCRCDVYILKYLVYTMVVRCSLFLCAPYSVYALNEWKVSQWTHVEEVHQHM